MARLIVKAPYIKSSGGGYLKYIGTRDGVELLPQSEIYIQYINERPRSHGLFGDEERVDLKSAIAEVESYTGNIWTPIISLRREDAVKFGYDNAASVKLIRCTYLISKYVPIFLPPSFRRAQIAQTGHLSNDKWPVLEPSGDIIHYLLFLQAFCIYARGNDLTFCV